MDPTAVVPDQGRPSSASPAMSSPPAADPHPPPPSTAAQPAELGSQASLPSRQKPNPTISPPPQNASAATASTSTEPSRNNPGPTPATPAASRKAPRVTTAAPSRNASRPASTTTVAPRRNSSGATKSAPARSSLSALAAAVGAVVLHPSVATTAAAPQNRLGASAAGAALRGVATASAVFRHPSVATAAAAPQNPLGAAAAGAAPRGSATASADPSVATAAAAPQNPLGTAAAGPTPQGAAPTRPEDYTPRMGMEFESEQQAYEFYRYYGWMVGFNVRKDYGNRSSKTGEITSRRFSCSRSRKGYKAGAKVGNQKRVPMLGSWTGCNAHLIIRRRKEDSKLEVYVFEPRHDHPLVPASSMPCPFQGTATADAVPPPDFLGLGGEPPAVQNSTEGDAVSTGKGPRRHLRTRRQWQMKYGEGVTLLNYFQEQSLAEPSFFHAVQLDVEDKVANIFWADGRMIVDYSQFGDVVAFDVVSRNNMSIRHFASFVGVNNFGEPIVFALALMYDGTGESFKWLFETFLLAMSGEAPKTFFSHHDPVIAKAVSLVMPNTSHAICARNLKHGAKKVLHQLNRGEDDCSFIKEFKACINEYEEETEFLTSWNAMINKHNLCDNLWLQNVFEEKQKWARPYVKGIFSAGMKGTQLNERLHSDLWDDLKYQVDVVLFLRHLRKVISDRRYKEMEIECSSRLKLPYFKIKAPILTQASEAYTCTIFQLFQEEYEEFQSAYIVKRDESGPCRVYTISIVEKEKQHTVYGNPTEQTVSCSCRKFETKGFLCSHALKVLDAMDIKYLPDRYIMKRWTKYARCLTSSVVPNQIIQADKSTDFSSRYQHMCQKYSRLIARASECEETFGILDKIWLELGKKVDGVLQMQTSIDASMIQPDVQDLMLSLSSIASGAGQGNLMDKSSKTTAKESKKGQKNKIQPRNCIEKGLRKRQKLQAKQPSVLLLSDASAQSGNALSQELEEPPNMVSVGSQVPAYRTCRGIDLSNSAGPINYEEMHCGLDLTFTPDGFVTYHTSQPSNSQYNQVNDSGGL